MTLNKAKNVLLGTQSLSRIKLGATDIWEWSPEALFLSGQQGVWYEPKPEYLYQDAAGTIAVTADGDPVGYMQDLSGNGNHATQSTSAARPVFPGLAYDGVDDQLGLGAIDVVPSPVDGVNFFVCFAVRLNFEDRVGLIGNRGGSNDGWTLRIQASALRYEHPGSWGVTSDAIPIDEKIHIITLEIRERVYFRLDGAAISDHARGVGITQSSTITRIAFDDQGRYQGDIGPVLMREGLLTEAERAHLENYLANLAGVTL